MSWTKKIPLLMLAALSASLVACGGASRNSVRGSGAGTTSTTGAQSCSSAGASGTINDDASLAAAGSFKTRVGQLVSATISPSEIGDINRIELTVNLKSDSSGNLAADSKLQITIHDSLVGQLDSSGVAYEPYPIAISHGASGSLDRSAQTFSATFTDAYGSITLQGSWSDGVLRGTVSFQNLKSYDGTSSPASGTLGVFNLPGCTVF